MKKILLFLLILACNIAWGQSFRDFENLIQNSIDDQKLSIIKGGYTLNQDKIYPRNPKMNGTIEREIILKKSGLFGSNKIIIRTLWGYDTTYDLFFYTNDIDFFDNEFQKQSKQTSLVSRGVKNCFSVELKYLDDKDQQKHGYKYSLFMQCIKVE